MELFSKWNSVEKRLPPIGEEVLVNFRQGNANLIFISSVDDKGEWYIGERIYCNPHPNVPVVAKKWTKIYYQ
jgi:hypothetical protein